MQIKLTRKELYELVWEQSLSQLMTTYTISYIEIKDLLKKHHIPSPANGYWSRLKAGHQIVKTPLPNVKKADEMIIYEPRVITVRTKKMKVTPVVPVSLETIGNLEKEVLQAKKFFLKQAKGRPTDQLVPIGYESLNMYVSPGALDRALYFMNKLIKSVKLTGGKIRMVPHSTFVEIDGEAFYVALREKQTRVEKINPKYSYDLYEKVASGTLIFKVGEQTWRSKEWSDTAYTVLEDKTDEIIQYLKSAAIKEKQDREERRLRDIELAKEKQVKADLQKRRSADLDKFVKFKEQSERWENAERMRRYLEELEKKPANEALQEYIEWAREKIAWYDPFIEREDELLKAVNKTTLTINNSYW